jgi:tetratricopeptide (TPR) repeat protein|tara:strand:- start:211 stop:1341 length:1131 start_codon:yes stop_codon:yes gene_type:complete
MKKNLLILTIFAIATTVSFSQKKNLTSAIMIAKAKKPNFVKAKSYIDKATIHENTKEDAKTWLWRANIYAGLSNSKSAAAKELRGKMDVVSEVMEAMKMTSKLDTKGYYRRDLKNLAAPMYDVTRNLASTSFNNKEYEVAYKNFVTSQEYAKLIGMTDSAGIYYTGRTADILKDYDNAILYYKKCVEIQYGGADLYLNLTEAYNKAENQEEASKVMEIAKAKFPNNVNIILSGVKTLLSGGKPAEAKVELEKALIKYANNFSLQYAAGITYNEMEMYTAAVIAYKKALELNPTDFNSKYNLSVVYNNMVVKMNDIVNAIPYNETAKYDKAKLERNDFINSVLPFIEKTFNEQEEPLIKKILNNFYSITKQNDKIKK